MGDGIYEAVQDAHRTAIRFPSDKLTAHGVGEGLVGYSDKRHTPVLPTVHKALEMLREKATWMLDHGCSNCSECRSEMRGVITLYERAITRWGLDS